MKRTLETILCSDTLKWLYFLILCIILVCVNFIQMENTTNYVIYSVIFYVYNVWQLEQFPMLMSGEYANPVQIYFVDLNTACNRVPRGVLWEICRIRSHDHLQSMDKITRTTWNLMQSNAATYTCYYVYPLFVILLCLNVLKQGFRLNTLHVESVFQFTRFPFANSSQMFLGTYCLNTAYCFHFGISFEWTWIHLQWLAFKKQPSVNNYSLVRKILILFALQNSTIETFTVQLDIAYIPKKEESSGNKGPKL